MFNKLRKAVFVLFKAAFNLFLFLAFFGTVGLLFPRFVFFLYAHPRTFNVETVPAERVAIVFGAAVKADGTPSAVLRDRVEIAVQLYKAGKVKKLLMSGDNRFVNYNEPDSMRQYAISLGVPEEDIVSDYAGRRTYDTCYRAHDIFGLNSAILVTQDFHLPRALVLCNLLGVKSTGVESNQYHYRRLSLIIWNVRETLATLASIYDVYWRKPLPVLGQFEPIYPEE
ncbi:MAG: ElyC/SanA/YdcF family protein [Anaerolineales bacterium]